MLVPFSRGILNELYSRRVSSVQEASGENPGIKLALGLRERKGGISEWEI